MGGEGQVGSTRSKAGHNEPACMAAHNLIGKLSNIMGNSDLLIERIEPHRDHARRPAVIREIASTAAHELAEHQHQTEAEKRKVD